MILPSPPNVVRTLLDRTFAAAGVSPNVVAEADVLFGILSALSTGMGSTVLPKGDFSDIFADQIALLIEPPLFLTASIISSGDFPFTYAGEAVRNVLMDCRTPFRRKRCARRRMDRMSALRFVSIAARISDQHGLSLRHWPSTSLNASRAFRKASIPERDAAIDRDLQQDLLDLVLGQSVLQGALDMQLQFMRPVERTEHRKIDDAAGAAVKSRPGPQCAPAKFSRPFRHRPRELVRAGNGLVDVVLAENFLANLEALFEQTASLIVDPFQVGVLLFPRTAGRRLSSGHGAVALCGLIRPETSAS